MLHEMAVDLGRDRSDGLAEEHLDLRVGGSRGAREEGTRGSHGRPREELAPSRVEHKQTCWSNGPVKNTLESWPGEAGQRLGGFRLTPAAPAREGEPGARK